MLVSNKLSIRAALLLVVLIPTVFWVRRDWKQLRDAVEQHLVPVVFASTATYTDPIAFQAAIGGLGTPTVIDFEDIDASPLNNSIVGRVPFDETTYADKGITFSNPNGFFLYIAPGGLFWNASNSLSVSNFPFEGGSDTDDDLVVTLNPPAVAVGFTLVDNGSHAGDEFVQFIDSDGGVVQQVSLPFDNTPFRAFIGVVSVERPIASINIVERANDGDDVDYDDFIFIPADKVTICHKPGTPAQKILVIPVKALKGHLGHGDTLLDACGACGSVLFEDDFEAGDLHDKWTTGGTCQPDSIVVTNGRVRATQNCNFIETRAAFCGDLQIEVDVEKEAARPFSCFDFYVELRALGATGAVLFDTFGTDGIGIGAPAFSVCGRQFTLPGNAPNRGKATLTYAGGRARFSFTNEGGQSLVTNEVGFPSPIGATAIRIWLAGYPDSPRFVDNVRVLRP